MEGEKINLSNLQKCLYLWYNLSFTNDILGIITVYKEGSGKNTWFSEDELNQPNQPNQPTR